LANVFISYARRNKERVAILTGALEDEGLSVWWDSDLVPGRRYRQMIATELAAADSVIVVWTTASLESDWVQDEAEEGRQRGVLIPVIFEPVRPPAGFRQVQAVDLSQWTGSSQHPEFRLLVSAVRSLAPTTPAEGASSSDSSLVETRDEHVPTIATPQPRPGAAPTRAALPSRLSRLLFDWRWWLGVAALMAALVAMLNAMDHARDTSPYLFSALPLLAGAAAMACRRAGVGEPTRRTVGWIVAVGAGVLESVLLVVMTLVFMQNEDGALTPRVAESVPGSLYFSLLGSSAVFLVAAGVGFLRWRARPARSAPPR
jgi:hypothetical protein